MRNHSCVISPAPIRVQLNMSQPSSCTRASSVFGSLAHRKSEKQKQQLLSGASNPEQSIQTGLSSLIFAKLCVSTPREKCQYQLMKNTSLGSLLRATVSYREWRHDWPFPQKCTGTIFFSLTFPYPHPTLSPPSLAQAASTNYQAVPTRSTSITSTIMLISDGDSMHIPVDKTNRPT